MPQAFTKSGGARIGWVNATWPLAQLSATSERLTIAVRFLGACTFTPQQVSAVERYVMIPLIGWGIRVRHQAPDYPQRVIFWCWQDPDTLLSGIRDAGFVPTAPAANIPARRGMPVRWSAIIAAVVTWNGLFMVPAISHRHIPATGDWTALVPLVVAFCLALGIPKSPALQRLVLKPDRNVGEIRPYLLLLMLICGILMGVVSITLAIGAFKQSPISR